MYSKSLGRMSNAPLAYVLAQVRFQPILEIEKFIPGLQSALRKMYPRYQPVTETAIQFGPHGVNAQQITNTRWEFGSPENCEGVIIHNSSLVYHVTKYSTYAAFGEQLNNIMLSVGHHIPDIFVERIGLRYVDFILPEKGEKPEDYVTDRLRCDPDLSIDFNSNTGLTVAEYNLGDKGHIVVRYYRGMGAPTLPQDLQLTLSPSEIMNKASKITESDETGVIDIDRILQINSPYDPASLQKDFLRLHRDSSTAFRAVTSKQAISTWTT